MMKKNQKFAGAMFTPVLLFSFSVVYTVLFAFPQANKDNVRKSVNNKTLNFFILPTRTIVFKTS